MAIPAADRITKANGSQDDRGSPCHTSLSIENRARDIGPVPRMAGQWIETSLPKPHVADAGEMHTRPASSRRLFDAENVSPADVPGPLADDSCIRPWTDSHILAA